MLLLKSILLDKYENKKLAQVYLATYSDGQNPDNFFYDYFKSITNLADHPDILWVTKEEKDNEYKVDSKSISSFLNFLNFKPIELKTKFIIFKDAHLLTTTLSNKFLKILEEMPSYFCLFLLSPQSESLLPTITSRAISLKLPHDNHDASLLELPAFNSVNELLLKLKGHEDARTLERIHIESYIARKLKNVKFSECDDMLEDLKHYDMSDNFNNSKLSRLSLFFK